MTRPKKFLPVVCVLLLAFATNHAATSENETTLSDILETVKNIEKILCGSSFEKEYDDIDNTNANRNDNAESSVNVNSNVNSNVFRRKELSRKSYIDDMQNELDNNELYHDVGQRRQKVRTRSKSVRSLPRRMIENYGKLDTYNKLMDQSNMNLNTNTNYIPSRRNNGGSNNKNLNYNANSNFNYLRKQGGDNDHSIEDDDDDDEFRRSIDKKYRRKSKKRILGSRMHGNENSNTNFNSNSNSNSNLYRRSNTKSNKNWNMNVNQNALDHADLADSDENIL